MQGLEDHYFGFTSYKLVNGFQIFGDIMLLLGRNKHRICFSNIKG